MIKMKDSGVPWIGEVPKNWGKSSMKYIGSYINGYAFKPDDWSSKGLPIIRIQDLTGSNEDPNYYEGQLNLKYLIKPDDILISWAATLDAFVWKGPEGWLNQHIFKALPNKDLVTTGYFLWLVKIAMLNMNNENKHGIVMQHVTAAVFNNFRVPLPPKQEQQHIADFLDAKCAEIDAILENTRASIEEYKKLKQSVITEAVTKGIRGARPMKDSGVEWIGEIPVEWRLAKTKTVCSRISDGSHFSPETVDEGFPYITAKDVHGIGLNYEVASKISKESFDALVKAGCQPTNGDVLLVKDGATTGRVGLVDSNEPCVLLSSVAILHSNEMMEPLFLYYLLQSSIVQEQIKVSMAGSAMPRITLSKIVDFYMTLPLIDEQQEIAAYLDEKCAAIDSLIASKEALITELEAYKKSIIYEYVTGKKEVPAI